MSNLKHVLKTFKKNRKALPYYFRYAEVTGTTKTMQQNPVFLAESTEHDTQQYVLEKSNKPVYIP
jgi:hypothetical protein